MGDIDTSTSPGKLLKGLKVIDFTSFMAGPYCSRWLADLGAEVIKIESIEGEQMRKIPPLRDGASSYFGHLNAGKKSISLNLKDPAMLELAQRLCVHADVVIEAFRPGVMHRLGLDASTLRTLNPKLIYCSISGFGQNNSASSCPAYAAIVHAASGFYMSQFGYQDGLQKPLNSGLPVADMLTAIFAAFSIQTALLARERTGSGTTIDVNLMDSITNMLVFELQNAQFPQTERRPLFKPLRTSDGFVIVMPISESNFLALCQAMEHPEWKEDPLFSTNTARWKNWDGFLARMEAWTSLHSAEHCERVLREGGVPCSRYRTIAESIADPQFAERASFAAVADEAGTFQTIKLPFSFDGLKPEVGGHVPAQGEHTEQVLRDWLDLAETEVEVLLTRGVISA